MTSRRRGTRLVHWMLLLLLPSSNSSIHSNLSTRIASDTPDVSIANVNAVPVVVDTDNNEQYHHHDHHHLRRSLTSPIDMTSTCVQSVTAIRRLQSRLVPDRLPAHFRPSGSGIKQPNDFDTSAYFTVLPHIVLPDSQTLDWVYDTNAFHPVLYVRNQNEKPFTTIAEYRQARCNNQSNNNNKCNDHQNNSYINEFTVNRNNAAAGYMQLVVLSLLGEQFYLLDDDDWQRDEQLICNDNMLQTVLQDIQEQHSESFGWHCDPISPADVERANQMDLTPTVTLPQQQQGQNNDAAVTVTSIVFTKRGGFYRLTHSFSTSNGMRVTDRDNLIPYDFCWMV